MDSLYLYRINNDLLLKIDGKVESIFNLSKYNEIVKEIDTQKFNLLKSVDIDLSYFSNKSDVEYIKYLFNLIIVNNISNYILDKLEKKSKEKLILDEMIKNNKKQIIRVVGSLTLEDVLGDVIICLVNSKKYLDSHIKIEYGNFEMNKTFDKKINIIDIFKYETNSIYNLKIKLKEDLIAFNFIKACNNEYLYTLPIYIDENSLVEKGLNNYKDFIVNWSSLAYLNMLIKIHNYFLNYYNLNLDDKLYNYNLLLALISILDYGVYPYPQGLKKSIEVGRATNGKCYFIDSVVKPISLTQNIAIALQSKDMFKIVPKLYFNR